MKQGTLQENTTSPVTAAANHLLGDRRRSRTAGVPEQQRFPWPAGAESVLKPASKSTLTSLAGRPSQPQDLFRPGMKSGVRMGRNSNPACFFNGDSYQTHEWGMSHRARYSRDVAAPGGTYGHPLLVQGGSVADTLRGFGGLFLTAGRMKVLTDTHGPGDAVHLYTIQAGRILRLDTETDEVESVFDMCKEGYFSKRQWSWANSKAYSYYYFSPTRKHKGWDVGKHKIVLHDEVTKNPQLKEEDSFRLISKILGGAGAGVAYTDANELGSAIELGSANELGSGVESAKIEKISLESASADHRQIRVFTLMQLHDGTGEGKNSIQTLLMIDAKKGSATEFEPQGIPLPKIFANGRGWDHFSGRFTVDNAVFTMDAVTYTRAEKRAVALFVTTMQAAGQFIQKTDIGYEHKSFTSSDIYFTNMAGLHLSLT